MVLMEPERTVSRAAVTDLRAGTITVLSVWCKVPLIGRGSLQQPRASSKLAEGNLATALNCLGGGGSSRE